MTNLSRKIAVDIEVVANPDMIEYLPEPKNLKDPVKIEKKKQEIIEKVALPPNVFNFGQIVCICVTDGTALQSFFGPDEKELLEDFFAYMGPTDTVITFNGISYDIPVIKRRAWWHRVKPSIQIECRRYNNANHIDVMKELNNHEVGQGGLGFYAKHLFGKELSEGSKVAEWFAEENWQEITKHCEEDVTTTWNLYKSLEGYYV